MHCVVAHGGNPTPDTTKLKGITATIIQHHVGFQVYCNLNHYSIHTLAKKIISKYWGKICSKTHN